ncbi:MAG: hypothetical protein AB7V44_30490, partial [Pseudonocardia sp.]
MELRLLLDTPVAEARVAVAVPVVRLPLAGGTPESWFPGVSALVAAPASAGRTLLPVTGGFGVDRLTAGITVAGGAVRPVITLTGVTIDGQRHPAMDLSSADAIAGNAGTVVVEEIDRRLGTGGFVRDLLLLAGLAEPRDPGHLSLFATAPTRAIARHHRGLLAGAGWGEPLAALARLLGVANPQVVDYGPGRWRVELTTVADTALALLATTRPAGVGGQELALE